VKKFYLGVHFLLIARLCYLSDYAMNFDRDFSTLHQCSEEAKNHTNGGSAKFAEAREQQEFPT